MLNSKSSERNPNTPDWIQQEEYSNLRQWERKPRLVLGPKTRLHSRKPRIEFETLGGKIDQSKSNKSFRESKEETQMGIGPQNEFYQKKTERPSRLKKMEFKRLWLVSYDQSLRTLKYIYTSIWSLIWKNGVYRRWSGGVKNPSRPRETLILRRKKKTIKLSPTTATTTTVTTEKKMEKAKALEGAKRLNP